MKHIFIAITILFLFGCSSIPSYESIKEQAMTMAQKQSESFLKGEVTKGTITQSQMDQIMKLVNSQTAK